MHHFEYFGRNEQSDFLGEMQNALLLSYFECLKMESSWAEAADTRHVDHGRAELESKIL